MNSAAIDTIVAREFPGVDPNSLERRRGQFHEVVIGANKAVSIAKTKLAASRLPDRVLKLEIIARVFPTSCTPKVVAVREDYLVMSIVPGTSFEELEMSLEQVASEDIADALSDILGTMLLVDTAQLKQMGLTITSPDRWKDLARRVEDSLVPLMSERGRVRARQEMQAASRIYPERTTLKHGDLGGTNIHWSVKDGIPVVTGILDWDEAQIGDISVDLAALQATFGPGPVRQIVANLDLEASILDRVDAIQGTFALQQALAGFVDTDQAEMEDGLREYI